MSSMSYIAESMSKRFWILNITWMISTVRLWRPT